MTKLNGECGKKGKKSLVFTNKISLRRTYLLPAVALRIANQDFCAWLVISRIAQDTGRLYSIGTNDIDRKIMLHSYIAKPIAGLAYFTSGISSCFYAIYAHKS